MPIKAVISDISELGSLRLLARILLSLRGFIVVISMSPHEFGQYTQLLLFIVYFSVADLGILGGLERELPHYIHRNDSELTEKTGNIGWSIYFLLTSLAGIMLFFVLLVASGQHSIAIAVSVALYLVADKWYRAYESFARIRQKYKQAGLASFTLAIVSLILILARFNHLSPLYIICSITAGTLAAYFFLKFKCPIHFQFVFSLPQYYQFIKFYFPVAILNYSIDIFHATLLTIVGFFWGLDSLGYFAFSFRIFQIFLALFPLLIQEVMKTRICGRITQSLHREIVVKEFLLPLWLYGVVIAIMYFVSIGFMEVLIRRYIPHYLNAVQSLKFLLLGLFPLGFAHLASDFLSSKTHGKITQMIMLWMQGIVIQLTATLLFKILGLQSNRLFAFAYIIAVYFLASRLYQSFVKQIEADLHFRKLLSLFIPIILTPLITLGIDQLISVTSIQIIGYLSTAIFYGVAVIVSVRHFRSFIKPISS